MYLVRQAIVNDISSVNPVCQELSRLLRCEDSAANSIVAGAATGACLMGLQRKLCLMQLLMWSSAASTVTTVQVERLQGFLQQ